MSEEPLWRPAPDRVARSNLRRFLELVRERGRGAPEQLDRLHPWSVARPEAFWEAVAEFCGLQFDAPPERIVDDPARMPGARWFEGARLNFARNLLRHDDDRLALIIRDETGVVERVTHRELGHRSRAFADALRRVGVVEGDRVVGFLPSAAEAVAAMLGAATVGATWSCCSTEFGVEAAVDRLGQLGPRVLVGAVEARWAGKSIDLRERLASIAEQIPSLELVVVVGGGGGGAGPPVGRGRTEGDLGGVPVRRWADFISSGDANSANGRPSPEGGKTGGGDVGERYASLPFDHPLYILFSSGTTGLPKCIVHGAGGTLLQHLKELVLHTDLTRSDTIFYYTTTGWMMWNWLVSALAVGATIVLYDGSPFHPADGAMWDLVEEEGVTVFGTSAKYLALAEKRGLTPGTTHDLGALRTILSTGSPLLPGSFDWVYRSVKADLHLASISGGTDIVSCFLLGDPARPVWRGELQGAGLGMAVDVLDADGRRTPPGQPGELVCTRAFPSMPVGFFGDPGGDRYRAAYFERYPGIWHHGDWAERTEHGGFVIHGRSDATLNPGGVRIGTAELYRPVVQFDEVLEALAIGIPNAEGDEEIHLFLVLGGDRVLDEELEARVRHAIRAEASPRHVPARIRQVADLPRTVSGKVSEIAARNAVLGRPISNRGALANPAVLEGFGGD